MNENGTGLVLLKAILIGVLTTVCVGLLLIIVCSAVALGTSDPEAFVVPCGVGALALSVLAGGVVSGVCGERFGIPRLLSSVLVGFFEVILMLILTVLPVKPYVNAGILLRLGVCVGVVMLSMLGGAVARPRKRKPGYYRKKLSRR